jgi:hypothetical protein
MSDVILSELSEAFVAPEKEFKGELLAPYTEGSRLLLMQLRDDEDSSIYFIWSFIFLHILLKNNRKQAIKLSWDKDLFREKLLEWVTDKNELDREMATTLVSAIIEDAAKAKVEPIPSFGGKPPNA